MKKYLPFLLLGFLFFAPDAHAAITFNASSSAALGTPSIQTVTSSITVSSAANTIVIANVVWQASSGGKVNTTTYNGVPMTFYASTTKSNSSFAGNLIYYLVNPPTGTNIVSTTFNSAPKEISLSVVAYSGVNQATPFGASSTITASAGLLASTSITTQAANSWILDEGGVGTQSSSIPTWTPGSGQTQRVTTGVEQGAFNFSNSLVSGDKAATTIGVYGMNETLNFSPDAWVYNVIELEAASVSATVSPMSFNWITEN